MKSSCLATRTSSVAMVILSIAVCVGAQTSGENTQSSIKDTGEQYAIAQLRAIVDEIKKCPAGQIANGDGSSVYVDAPMNVVWNVQPNESLRSKEMGYIEFVQHSVYIPRKLVPCKKRDADCNRLNAAIRETDAIVVGLNLPDNFRYEFDFGPRGLEFTRALKKHEEEDSKHWLAMNPGNGCEAKTISIILGYH